VISRQDIVDEPANEDDGIGTVPVSAAATEGQEEPLTDDLLRRLREAGL
jgi:hypothetical protein